MDKGEIFYFSKSRKELARVLETATKQGRPTSRKCPKTGENLIEIPLLAGEVVIDLCHTTGGMWFDKSELKKLLSKDPKELSLALEPEFESFPEEDYEAEDLDTGGDMALPLTLPNLAFRATMTVVSLYALLTLVLILCVEFAKLPPAWALIIGVSIAAIQFLLGPWLMDLSLNWFYKMQWVPMPQLPEHLQGFVQRVCAEKGMKVPRFGVIDDGGPNAFTYGHTPNNARVVVTRGLFDLLDQPEVEAVVAHEIGHAKNWDMFLMTVVQLVPLVLYYLYRTLIHLGGDGGDRKGSGYVALVAMLSFVLYIITEYIVLWFSRTREYYADRFAGQVTSSPNSLSSALVKIAYGLAGQEGKEDKEEKKEIKRSPKLEAIGAMGIFDAGSARAFAVAAYDAEGSSTKVMDMSQRSNILGAMKWDMWNPWARYFEIHSTHPLVANRMNHLGHQALSLGQEPFIRFSLRKPESYWDEFFVDIVVMFLPFVSLVLMASTAFLLQLHVLYGVAFAAMGLMMLVKLGFSYPTDAFPGMSVSSLLKKVKVSGVRGIPCTLKGRIVGKGVPGLIWSEDFVLRDETGIIFLDYRQPLRIWEFFFGLMRSEELQDTEVQIEGWYRRSPMPYVELKTLKTPQKTRKCYVYAIKVMLAYLFLIGGIAATVLMFLG
jgi:heat shock protein HtpX